MDKAPIYSEFKHILPGAISLAGMAGYINSVVLAFFATPVSHMSGAVSRLGVDIAERSAHESFESVLIILGFLFGSVLAGIFVGATKVGPARRYGVVLMFEGVLLFVSAWLLVHHSLAGPVLAATACGLQNAMTTGYCGLMIRTTHVSGMVTDLGIMIGHWLRYRRIATWKFKFLVSLLFAFGAGGVLGAYCNILYGPICLIGAAIGCFGAGAVFFAALQRQIDVAGDGDVLPRTSMFPDEN